MSYTLATDIDLAYTIEQGILTALGADHRLRVRGSTYATDGDPKESGDASNQLSGWSLSGVNYTNSTGGVLYWKLANVASTRTVYLYSDSAKTALVAQGSSVGDGAIALTAQNGSGVSGAVTVAYTTDDNDAGNYISSPILGIKKHLAEYIPLESYDLWASWCPLLTVNAARSADELVAFGRYEAAFAVRIETRLIGRDLPTLRRNEKRVLDNVRSFIRWERSSSGTGFNSVLSNGDGYVRNVQTEYMQLARHDPATAEILNYVAAGAVTFEVRVHVDAP